MEAFFAETNLEKSVFTNSELSGAVFDHTNLKQADFRLANNFDISPTTNNIKKALFSSDGLPGLLSEFNIKIS